MAQGRIRRDAGAQQWSRRRQIQITGHAQHKGFIHDDAFGITAIGRAPGVFIRAVVGEGHAVLAKLFEAVLAAFASAARIYQATNGGDVAFLELFNLCTGFHDAADDFMAGHAWVGRAVPFVADGVQIRVANATIKDLDLHVVRTGIAALNGSRCERRGLSLRGISFGLEHAAILSTSAR